MIIISFLISNFCAVFFADVGGFVLDSHHGFVVEYGYNRDIELGMSAVHSHAFSPPKYFGIVVCTFICALQCCLWHIFGPFQWLNSMMSRQDTFWCILCFLRV